MEERDERERVCVCMCAVPAHLEDAQVHFVHGHAGPALIQAHVRAVQRTLPRDDHIDAGGGLALPQQLHALCRFEEAGRKVGVRSRGGWDKDGASLLPLSSEGE